MPSTSSTGIPRPAVAHGDRVVGVDRDLDRVVVARERLVDRVDDDLLDEVMEAPQAGRADVHPGPQTDRLEAFEHGDVLGRVSGLCLGLRHNQEMPAKRRFCEAPKVYQIGRLPRPRARLKVTAFCTLSRRFSSSIVEAIARARSASSGLTSTRLSTGSASGSGSGPGAKRTFGTPSLLGDLGGALAELERPDRIGRVHVHACRRGRCARARRCARSRSPTAAGQRSTSSAMPACGPKRESSERIWLPSGSSFDLHDLGGLDRQRRPVRRGDHRLPHARNALREHLAPAGIELGEHVVEQQQAAARAAALLPRAAARAPRAAARPVSRTGAGRGRRSRSATSSRCGPSPVAPRSRSRASRLLERLPRRRLGVVPESRRAAARAPPLAAANAGPSSGERLAAPGDELARRASRPAPSTARARPVRRAPSCTRRSAAFRCASAAR